MAATQVGEDGQAREVNQGRSDHEGKKTTVATVDARIPARKIPERGVS